MVKFSFCSVTALPAPDVLVVSQLSILRVDDDYQAVIAVPPD
ncbi:hypothetical protein [Nostoc sp.]